MHVFRVFYLAACLTLPTSASALEGALRFHRDPRATFFFQGFVGERIAAGVTNWLVSAPGANPGMLEMFQLRDRLPAPNLVPWAGEFVGKYLISAIQTERLGHPQLHPIIAQVIGQLIDSQADDGYLGPFPKNERLLGHWDLWGHYHVLLALLLWHEQTADPRALAAARRAADLACRIYLDGSRRMIDAGSDEMNLSIIHALGWLYRVTREDRYLRLMRGIEKDWERGGDFIRTGLAGLEFYQTPRPRWEGLHSLQGLVELWQITGDPRYRRAFEHHWRSIARWELRNTGGFSSGEQATGDPYAPTPIETCCSIAWIALTTDMLRLTGDPRAADLLELATLNAWAGAQHPSGRWCTYNTPMDGVREASAHTIVFQSRPGTPELNCCSVNGPRGWGMLSDWALLQDPDGLVLNWLAPSAIDGHLPDGSPVRLEISGDYPVSGRVRILVRTDHPAPFSLRLRIPRWSANPHAAVDLTPVAAPSPGHYLVLSRAWSDNEIDLDFDLPLWFQPGAREAENKVALYHGPLLLAWDQRFNDYDSQDLPPLGLSKLAAFAPVQSLSDGHDQRFPPQLLLQSSVGERQIRLVDFATAGANGTHYLSWLPTTHAPPPPAVARLPRDLSTIPAGPTLFRWTGSKSDLPVVLEISANEDFSTALDLQTNRARATIVNLARYSAGTYYWRIRPEKPSGRSLTLAPPAQFTVDPQLPVVSVSLPASRGLESNGALIHEPLRKAAADGTTLDGETEKLIFPVGEWPEESYSVALRVRINRLPSGRLGQIVSAWAGSMDDPLRLTIDQGKLFARIESHAGFSTPGVPVETNRWYRLVAVRDGTRLSLFLDGEERARVTVPPFTLTRAEDFALGGNPHYSGNEHLAMTVADLSFFPRALTPAEISAESTQFTPAAAPSQGTP